MNTKYKDQLEIDVSKKTVMLGMSRSIS